MNNRINPFPFSTLFFLLVFTMKYYIKYGLPIIENPSGFSLLNGNLSPIAVRPLGMNQCSPQTAAKNDNSWCYFLSSY